MKSAANFQFAFISIFLIWVSNVAAITRTSVSSGNWNSNNTWSPSGTPAPIDNVIIAAGHTVTVTSTQSVNHVTVNQGGILTWSTNNNLSVLGNLSVNGTVNMNGGNISMANGKQFILGAASFFTWNPGTNTAASATLFTNSTESFSPTSTLIVKKWYDYNVPIGQVVTGNFGNLELNSPQGTNIAEWNQKNNFQTKQILGTLTVDAGWITLDKSGLITNTNIGRVVLKNVNSSFYAHNGTHPGSFIVTIGEVDNIGGNFIGLNNGNGNVRINITGNFTNRGNVKLINNSGVANLSNGDATFNVGGIYSQITGDTRIIYNISTTNSGLFNSTINNLSITGGIFMGQSACRTTAGTCSLTVTQNLTINFANATDKFRGTSLSSIGANLNNVNFYLNVGGNLNINGPSASEFTSSASAGTEQIIIGGNLEVNGSTVSFNYGSLQASHNLDLTVMQSLNLTGGTLFLSRNNGSAACQVFNSLNINNGSLSLKAADGAATLNVNGNFNMASGTFFLHNNNTAYSTLPVIVNVIGNFTHSGGTINFDSNTNNISAEHSLNLGGSAIQFSGNGQIIRGGAGSCFVFGLINFNRIGSTNLTINGTTYLFNQAKIQITAGTVVNVVTGNIRIASHQTLQTPGLKLLTGGKLNLNNSQIISNGLFGNCNILLDSASTLSITKPEGLYDGTTNASISNSGNINFSIHSFSEVEYAGTAYQVITGTGNGIATGTQHEYGILSINKSGISDSTGLSANNVIVRTRLNVSKGTLKLNGKLITIRNGAMSSISRTSGFIDAELNATSNPGTIVLENIQTGQYVIPFGKNGSYIPVTLTVQSSNGSEVSISTYGTSAFDNLPYPVFNNVEANVLTLGNSFAADNLIDRWWILRGSGIQASITVNYLSEENSLLPSNRLNNLNALRWDGLTWNYPSSNGQGVMTGTGSVNINGLNSFGAFGIGLTGGAGALPIELSYFDAKLISGQVALKWSTSSETNNEYFSVERSTDGEFFYSIKRIPGAGNSTTNLHYSCIDENPVQGISYYRLKQNDFDGKFSYSEVKSISNNSYIQEDIRVNGFGPNPFESDFWVGFEINKPGSVQAVLSNSNGQTLYNETIYSEEGSNRFEYKNGNVLNPGIYYLKLIYKEKAVTQKLIKK